jgi:4'-phosphopantetheinyl transferase
MQLDLWLVELDLMPDHEVQAVVSVGEIRRAAALAVPQERARYLSAHAALRLIVSEVAQIRPSALEFATGKYGKPCLVHDGAPPFNMSHSENWALVGIGKPGVGQPAMELGVDLEVWRDIAQPEHMLAHIAAQHEIARFPSSTSQGLAGHPLLDLWTRKEACMKAVGAGLHWDPRTIEVGHAQQTVELSIAHEGCPHVLRVDSVDLSHFRLSAAVAQVRQDPAKPQGR